MTVELEIRKILEMNRYAVLATQDNGQPHTSLMAFTPMDGIRQLIVATYRSTLKYRSLIKDGRVAIWIDGRALAEAGDHREIVLTAHGVATEVATAECAQVGRAHMDRHPELLDFLSSPDCALLSVAVSAYIVVGGTEDVFWYQL